MTATDAATTTPAPAPARPGGVPEPAPAQAQGSDEPEVDGPEVDEPGVAAWLPGAALLVLAVALVVFLADLTVVGTLRHDRDQRTTYDQLRYSLAEGTAPVGQTDDQGRLLPLGTPVAVLEAPQLGLREVVLEGTTSGVLTSGVGHRRDTPLPGQAGTSVLMGRQAAFGGPFRRLPALAPGNTLTVVTGQATSLYRVIGVRRAGDPVPAALAAGKGRLTMITADGPAWMPTGVLRVDADLVTGVQPAPRRVLPLGSVTAPEQPMQGDPSTLIVLVLWGEALVGAALGVAFLRRRWGRWQTWVVAVPALGVLALLVADQAARLLPNLT